MKIPDVRWILARRVLKLGRRRDWVLGHVDRDGFRWTTREVDDSFLSYMGHEANLSAEILREGELFVDVGAHVGTWSVRASKYYRRIISFEPSQNTRKALLHNIRLNHVENIEVRQEALSDKRGVGTMYHFGRMSGGNRLNDNRHPLLRSIGKAANTVSVETLDEYRLSPTLLKIDTEGNELPILRGATETLKRTQRIIVESHRLTDVPLIENLLRESGFNTHLKFYHDQPHHDQPHIIGQR